jgi:endonuclease III related protein
MIFEFRSTVYDVIYDVRMNFKIIYDKLFAAFGEQHWWPAQTPFEMMTGAILTQNTAWSNVERAIANFDGRLSPDFILNAPARELAYIIKPSGFYNQKSVRLKILADWYKGYGCDIDRVRACDPGTLRQELLSLSGVGCETADSIMLYALGHPYFAVDAYTQRIFTRLGFALPDDYEGIRSMFELGLVRDAGLYGEYHALIVHLAKLHCKKTPVCCNCPLEDCCNNSEMCKIAQNAQ